MKHKRLRKNTANEKLKALKKTKKRPKKSNGRGFLISFLVKNSSTKTGPIEDSWSL